MAESSHDVVRHVFDAADMSAVNELCPQIQKMLLDANLGVYTIMTMVSCLAGWVWATLDAGDRVRFEQCIEVNFEQAAESSD